MIASNSTQIDHLQQIFTAALERANPYQILKNSLYLKDNQLEVNTEHNQLTIDLTNFDELIILGWGKAAAKMAVAIEEIFAGRIDRGLIITKYGHTESLQHLPLMEAGHPIPDENSLRAAQKIKELLSSRSKSPAWNGKGISEKTLIISLISGGGSALIAYPMQTDEITLTLADQQQTTQTLLSCGATIHEINCIRKHLSMIKGGQLVQWMSPATAINLILSDVVGDRLEVISSGMTAPDPSTYQDAQQIIEKYNIAAKIPANVMKIIEEGVAGKIKETPKPNAEIFDNIENILIGTNYLSLLAAEKKAKALGYHSLILSSHLTGEAKEIAKFFVGIARDIQKHNLPIKKPACIIAGGETTVTIHGNGKGGRNQELALSFLAEMERYQLENENIYFLSAATDGNDGPTDAAGAFAAPEISGKANIKKLNIQSYLKNNDAYHFYEKTGFLLKTGATNTNVCDVQILILT